MMFTITDSAYQEIHSMLSLTQNKTIRIINNGCT